MQTKTQTQVVKDYGCVKCQKYHREGDPLYTLHLFHQSKHGIRVWTETTKTKSK
jgi:hypothetical protein